jgi:beta-glucosidase
MPLLYVLLLGVSAAQPWLDRALSPDQRADLVVQQMTLDEKISLLHGTGWAAVLNGSGGAGFIPGIPRLKIPDLQMADAAMGVTRGARSGRYSTPLPSCVALASTWDPAMAREYGALIGRELRDQGYNMSLGGGINLARDPRNGRTFEYQGEDPVLAGKMVGAEMKALQEQGVIGDLKHYALNDQESGRNSVNVKIGERAMRESDLLAFEIGLRESGAGAVMCSYNQVNGDYACENSYLLNDVLKHAFGFRGFVLSDWGATHSTAKAALAGLDLEMPEDTYFGAPLKNEVPLARINDMVHRILRTEFAIGLFDNPPDTRVPDVFHGIEVAREVEEQAAVLLKNANAQLPLRTRALRSIAVIGSHADAGVLSGGGSAQVDPPGGNAVPPPPRTNPGPPTIEELLGQVVWHPSSPLKAIRAKAPQAKVTFDSGTDPAAAAKLAHSSDVAIVFVNQPASEAKDAPNLSLPDNQDALVAAVAAANPHTIVVLETGGPVTMPWAGKVKAILEAWYPGIMGAEAIANILFGDVNPSAKLPLTFPADEADLAHPKATIQPPPREHDMAPLIPGLPFLANTRPFDIQYDEGLKVGYKWFDAEGKKPLFPFGFGLSYTTFAYSNLALTPTTVTFRVKNTGARAGAEIAQVYAALPQEAGEPFKRLLAWQKVPLAPGEVKTVTLPLDPHLLSIFDAGPEAWRLVPGEYKIYVGGSSRDLPLTGSESSQNIANPAAAAGSR